MEDSLQTSPRNSSVAIQELLEAGCHFGHQKRRWNPKMKPYIYEVRGKICIIDLAKTKRQILLAEQVIAETVSRHESILLVGTKKQAKEVIRHQGIRCPGVLFFVNSRWLGGTLTNFKTIRASVKTLERVEQVDDNLTKKEQGLREKLRVKLDTNLAGIRDMRKLPGLVIVVDPTKEHIAVNEANKLNIPVIALGDTDCDPGPIKHLIACNDDALKSVQLIVKTLVDVAHRTSEELSLLKEQPAPESSVQTPVETTTSLASDKQIDQLKKEVDHE